MREGGAIIFEEDMAFFQGSGNYFTEIATRRPHQNVIIAGELVFTSQNLSDLETCGLFARVIADANGNADAFVQIGLSNAGEVFYIDRPLDETQTILRVQPLAINLNQAHYLLAILIEDKITVYVDGERIFEQLPLLPRKGSYGIALTGGVSGSRCEGRDIWAFEVA
jgi:hypothetical protein